jgi:hypothetical protein
LDDGEVWTWASPGTSVTVGDLEGGLPGGMSQADHRQQLIGFIADYLQASGRLALIEDHDASPSDPWLASEPVLPPRLACGKRVYWYIRIPERLAVDESLRWGLGLFNCIALSSYPLVIQESGQLTVPAIDLIAYATEHVVLDAFDFEGFIIWSRQ